jgi:rhodanese-related sulfurtransferase
MKKYKGIYSIIGSLVVVAVMIIFSIYATKCHGDSCSPKPILEEEKQVLLFPKMIPDMIKKQVENKEILLLDVREDSEWEAGHIAGAKHLVLSDLSFGTVRSLPKDIPIYVYCRSGKRANEATIKLHSFGFNQAENIGGVIYWQERGGMLTKL